MDENYQKDSLSPSMVDTAIHAGLKTRELTNQTSLDVDYSASEILDEIRSMKGMVEDLRERIEDDPRNLSRSGRILLKHLNSRQVDQRLANRIVKAVEERIEKEHAGDFARTRELCVQSGGRDC